MKRRNRFAALAIALALVCGFSIGAGAADTIKEIKAYLDYGITVKYNGETQALKDASGNTVYPITYNGTTYLPVRAVSNILGIAVDWDQATKSVILGDSADETDLTDLIENFVPYTEYAKRMDYGVSLIPAFIQSADNQSRSIGGETVDHWISLRYSMHTNSSNTYPCSFNLGGKYSVLTFKVYSEKDLTLTIKGDNDSVLGEYSLKGGQVPQTITVDLRNTTQLTFDYSTIESENYYGGDSNRWYTYIFNAILE